MDFIFSALAQEAAPPRQWADIINDLARTPLSQVVLFVAALTVIRVALYPILMKTEPHKRMGGYKTARFVNELLDAFVYAGAFVFLLIRPFALQTFQIPSGSMWPTLHVHDYIVANKAIYRYTDPKRDDVVVFRPPVEATFDNQRDANGEVNVDFIKRLIGVPGDIIEVKEGVLYRNGQPVTKFTHYSECTEFDRASNPQNCVEFRPLEQNEVDHLTKASFKLVEHDGKTIPVNYTDYDVNAPRARSIEGDSPYSVAEKYQVTDPQEAEELRKAPPAKIPAGYYLMMGDNRNGSFDGRGWGLVPRASIIGRSEFIWLPLPRWGITR